MDDKDIPLPSNRTFGLFFAGVFAIVCAYTLWHDNATLAAVSAALSAGFLGVTVWAREKLTPLNRLWMRFGLLLSKIVSPIVLGILFFLIFTPIAVVTRAFGRDELRIKKKNVASHWKNRDPAGPEPASFSNQF